MDDLFDASRAAREALQSASKGMSLKTWSWTGGERGRPTIAVGYPTLVILGPRLP